MSEYNYSLILYNSLVLLHKDITNEDPDYNIFKGQVIQDIICLTKGTKTIEEVNNNAKLAADKIKKESKLFKSF